MDEMDKKMKECEFCKELINENAKKCKVCGEWCQWYMRVLKATPLILTILPWIVTGISGIYAYTQRNERQKETLRAERLEKANIAVSQELSTAKQATLEIARKLPESSKEEITNNIIKDLRLPSGPPNETLRQLEQKAKSAPDNSQIQKDLYIFRALKDTD